MSKFLIAGLGNIGEEYSFTRHNIGFEVADALVKSLIRDEDNQANKFFSKDKLAFVNHSRFKGKQIVIIKPTTYMNLSGKAFKYWLDKEKLDIAATLTLVDDIALPLNKLRLRGSGSDAGHNGLKDIQLTLGTDEYAKLRFGIGNNFQKGGQVDFVLGKWLPEEQPMVNQKIAASCEIIEQFAAIGLDKAMNMANSLLFT